MKRFISSLEMKIQSSHNSLYVVIPAKAGIQSGSGCRIKSGMTVFAYFAAGLAIMARLLRER
jgi:hypothetical protein